jgi:hypothetical protein
MLTKKLIVCIKALGLLTVFFQLAIFPTGGCDYRYLDSEAEAMGTKLWSGHDITESQIRKSLGFVENKEEVKQDRYENFQGIMQDSRSSIHNERFNSFANICQRIYETSDDEGVRIAISIFFQEVTNKYRPYYILQKEMHKTLERYKSPPKKGCDFHGINLSIKQDDAVQELKASSEIKFIRLSQCGLSSDNFKRLTMMLDLKEFSQLQLIDISSNPIDKTAALALAGWLELESQPYVKLTETDLKASKVESLYDELRHVFTTKQVAEFMKRVIFVTRSYLSNTQLKNDEVEVYNRLVQAGKIPTNWKDIHLEFYKKYFTKKPMNEAKKQQTLKSNQKLTRTTATNQAAK